LKPQLKDGSASSDHKRRVAVRALGIVAGVSVAVLALAWLLGVIAPELSDTNSEFFVICGHVAPIYGLAIFVEVVVVMSRIVREEGATSANRGTVYALLGINAAMLVIAQSAALYAAGASESSGFLIGCCVLPLVVQLLIVLDSAYRRTGLAA